MEGGREKGGSQFSLNSLRLGAAVPDTKEARFWLAKESYKGVAFAKMQSFKVGSHEWIGGLVHATRTELTLELNSN